MIICFPATLLLLIVSAWPNLAAGHVVITYPGWRGNNLARNDAFPFGMQWSYPCMFLATHPASGRFLTLSCRWGPIRHSESHRMAHQRRCHRLPAWLVRGPRICAHVYQPRPRFAARQLLDADGAHVRDHRSKQPAIPLNALPAAGIIAGRSRTQRR